MARHAARIAVNGAELLVAAGAVEARRLKTHGIDIGARRSEPTRLVLDRRDQLGAVVLAAHLLVDPEPLDEQHRGPDLPHDPADDLAAVLQRDRDALQSLRPHVLVVVTGEPGEHSLLGGPNGALDGEGGHCSTIWIS